MGTTRLGQTSQCTGARSSAITKVQLRWFLLPVPLGDVAGGGQQFLDYSGIGECAVGGHLSGRGPCSRGRVKNRRVAARSRFSETRTSMTCPNWSIPRYR